MLTVREIQASDIPNITNYWLDSTNAHMLGMGVDLTKMPTKDEWFAMLTEQIQTPLEEKKSYCILWEVDNIPVGHSNINKIKFGKEAYMHLHLWEGKTRKQGFGLEFVKKIIPYFFEKFKLEKLYCEPYALNPAPNKTLAKLGFKLVKTYTGVPGFLNFEQEVNLWELNKP